MRDARLTVGKAYLLQAEEDLQAAKTIGNNLLTAPSTFCMLLQMVFEKLAKAEKYKAWEMLPTHLGHELASEYFTKFFSANMRMAPRQRKYSRLIGLIQELERLQPSIARRISENEPQLEYLWSLLQKVASATFRSFGAFCFKCFAS